MEDESPELPPLFEDLLEGEPDSEDAEGDANSDLLNVDEMEDEEDDSTFPVQQSRPPSASDAAPPVDGNLCEVCKRAAAKLGVQWPAAQDAEETERDLYNGKRLPPAQPPSQQLLTPVPACMKEMSRCWSSPFKSKLPTKGYSKLGIHGMGELGLAEPPAVEPSVAFHLHPNRLSLSLLHHFSARQSGASHRLHFPENVQVCGTVSMLPESNHTAVCIPGRDPGGDGSTAGLQGTEPGTLG